jgi:N-acetylglucosamine kinase-like BadF-type ATPase
LLDATGLPTANGLLHHFYAEVPRAEIAALSRLVAEAAEQGDEVARCILAEAAAELARLAEAVFRMLFTPGEHATVAYIGGLFKSPLLCAEFANQVRARTGCTPLPPQFGPAAGAVLEALRADGNESALQISAEEK